MLKPFEKRQPWSHKGDFGRVLIVAGNNIYTGVPYFNAMGAWRTGVDLVHIVGHRRAMDAVAAQASEFITHPLNGDLKLTDLPLILELTENADAVLIGGGLSSNAETNEVLLRIITKLNKPMVLDAQAIHALHKAELPLKEKKILLTPHAGEFFALTGEKLTNNLSDRIKKIEKYAKKLGVTILLKGHIDIISDGKTTRTNKTGNPFMTKGGTGDVLAGLCLGFLAQGYSLLDSATYAAYSNGKAGENALKKFGSGFRIEEMLKSITF